MNSNLDVEKSMFHAKFAISSHYSYRNKVVIELGINIPWYLFLAMHTVWWGISDI